MSEDWARRGLPRRLRRLAMTIREGGWFKLPATFSNQKKPRNDAG